jgi:hypothetical protein
MKAFLGVIGVLLLLGIPYVAALQAVDAETLVSHGQYLEAGERGAVFKALPQMYGEEKYWLVSVYLNDSLRTIIPVDDEGSLVESGTMRTSLVSSQLLVQSIVFIKNQYQWLVSLTNANSLEELSNALENEQFDLEVVEETLTESDLRTDVRNLKTKLLQLSGDLQDASSDVERLNGIETAQFNVEIDTFVMTDLDDDYIDLFEKIKTIQELAGEYDNKVSKIKNDIASSDSLDTNEKSQLIGLLNPFGVSQTLSSSVSSYAALAADNRQKIETEYAGYPVKVAAFEAELENRLLRSQAYNSIYSEDPFLKKNTRYDSLADAAATILDANNKPFWKDQSNVLKLDAIWPKILDHFSKKNYETALEFSGSAKQLVKKIDEEGTKDASQENQGLMGNIVFGLGIVLIVIVLFLFFQKFVKKPKILSPSAESDPFKSS